MAIISSKKLMDSQAYSCSIEKINSAEYSPFLFLGKNKFETYFCLFILLLLIIFIFNKIIELKISLRDKVKKCFLTFLIYIPIILSVTLFIIGKLLPAVIFSSLILLFLPVNRVKIPKLNNNGLITICLIILTIFLGLNLITTENDRWRNNYFLQEKLENFGLKIRIDNQLKTWKCLNHNNEETLFYVRYATIINTFFGKELYSTVVKAQDCYTINDLNKIFSAYDDNPNCSLIEQKRVDFSIPYPKALISPTPAP